MPGRISKSTTVQAVALAALVGLAIAMPPMRNAQALRLSVDAPADRALFLTPFPPAPLFQIPVLQAPIDIEPAPLALAPPERPVPRYPGMVSTWQKLQPALRAEAEVLSRCRADMTLCPPAAAKFLAIVEAARGQSGRARLGHINRAVNLAIQPVSDLAQYGVPDVWATPLMSFASGKGDCEDYAIAKYVALRETGIAASELRLNIVHDNPSGEDHAVVAARLGGEWLILDNRRMAMLTDTEATDLTLLAALGGDDDAPRRLSAAPAAPAGSRAEVVLAGGFGPVYAD